jgi:hypothetical protein
MINWSFSQTCAASGPALTGQVTVMAPKDLEISGGIFPRTLQTNQSNGKWP